MASQEVNPVPPISPQVIASAFVQQYYHILHRTPDQVHKFYNNSSIMSRPDTDGSMATVSTMQAINEKIISMDFSKFFTEIETVDSQLSYKDGVLIVVTGSLTATDNLRRKFTQSFFLAPQENGGYFVLNDVFRFVTEGHCNEPHDDQVMDKHANNDFSALNTPPAVEPEVVSTAEQHIAELPTVETEMQTEECEEVIDPSENSGSGIEEVIDEKSPTATQTRAEKVQSAEPVVTTSANEPKKSYATVVRELKENPAPVQSNGVSKKVKPLPKLENADKPQSVPVKPPIPAKDTATKDTSVAEENHVDVPGYSIYVRNLPINATVEQVEQEFKKFGIIKSGGVQVRQHKIDRFCFGFVEFENLDSMQAAIQASPITMGGHQVYAEEKRTTTRVVNGVVTRAEGDAPRGGRFLFPRGGFRNDSFRGRGHFGNGGYPANEFRNRGGENEFRNRGGENEFRNRGENEFRSRGGENEFRNRGGENEFRNNRGENEFRNRGEFIGRGRAPAANGPMEGYSQRGGYPQRGGYQQRDGGYQQRNFLNGNGRFIRQNGPPQNGPRQATVSA